MFSAKIATPFAKQLPQLAAAAFICLSLNTNTQVDRANTVEVFDSIAAANKAPVASVPQLLPQNLQVLSPKDSNLYRSIFAAQKKADWKSADKAISKLVDRRLLGHVLAERYKQGVGTLSDMQAWLVSYPDLPQAEDIYEHAQSKPLPEGTVLMQPSIADNWTGTSGYGSSVGFRADANVSQDSANTRHFAATIDRTLRNDDPAAAEALLEAEQNRREMTMRERGAIQGRIAASYFYDGQVIEAHDLAVAAAPGLNPLALWIGGLSAWKQGDIGGAGEFFGRLANQPNLSDWDHSAAAFWAYRAVNRAGNTTQARSWLKQAALQPHSFYGYMAAHLLGRDTQWSWDLPALDNEDVAILSRLPAGWRALALLQAGQIDLAESELRHLNPQGQRNLQAAMLAVAESAQMPSLALRLGGMATNTNGRLYDAALYPVPPWQLTVP